MAKHNDQIIGDVLKNMVKEMKISPKLHELKIKKFWGFSENAVKSQIWIAVCTYLIIAILKKQLNLDKSLYEILQILSVSVFDKTPVNQLLTSSELQILKKDNHNQLILFNL